MAANSPVSNEVVFYPPRVWGLDYHFNTFNKLYVADILSLKPYPSYPGAFAYKNHPIYKVDVMGVVVRKDDRQKLFLYSVDDGTGVVNCCCWKYHFWNNDEQGNTAGFSPELCSLLESLEKERKEEVGAYELGDLVHVRGKLKLFRDMMEIVAHYHCKIDNPQSQVTRMLELPNLYRQCYDKVFVPPYKIQQELLRTNKGTALSTQKYQSLRQQLTGRIQLFLHKEKMEEFSHSDLLKDQQIAELVTEMDKERDSSVVVDQVLRRLEEEEGVVCCRRRSSPPYENLMRTSPLERLIGTVLERECVKSKYAEKGCHYLHLLDELKKTVQYSGLHHTALLHVLARLETDSDVIRITDKCYRPL
ncbi:CST complex subunit STN1-like [Littorina saxatilis]|uniref:CST complex subunit STN1-like n=1 Tax=Littorina saxatilis TaxID=31220 RepID=UPI0038B670A8